MGMVAAVGSAGDVIVSAIEVAEAARGSRPPANAADVSHVARTSVNGTMDSVGETAKSNATALGLGSFIDLCA